MAHRGMSPPITNQLDKKMDHETETGIVGLFIWVRV